MRKGGGQPVKTGRGEQHELSASSRARAGATHLSDGFFDTAESCSFVGRPFPLKDADVHLTRLRAYGVTIVRLIVLWEAIE